MFCITAHELVYATGAVDKFLFAREERVRRTGDFEFYQRVSNPVDFDGVFCRYRGAGDERIVIGHIFEYDRTVILWVNAFFHI